MTKIIEVIVSSAGETTVKTKGFQGSSCRDASKFLEEALGKVAGERLTPEFHQAHSAHQSQRQRS